MKRKKLHKHLFLNKKTIVNLEEKKLRLINGGGTIEVTDYTCGDCLTDFATCHLNCTTANPQQFCQNTCECPNTSVGGICEWSVCQC